MVFVGGNDWAARLRRLQKWAPLVFPANIPPRRSATAQSFQVHFTNREMDLIDKVKGYTTKEK